MGPQRSSQVLDEQTAGSALRPKRAMVIGTPKLRSRQVLSTLHCSSGSCAPEGEFKVRNCAGLIIFPLTLSNLFY